MSETKHTPGPWSSGTVETNGSLDASIQVVFSGNKGNVVACAVGEAGGLWGDEDRANARLIAAAPDLLEVCRWLVDYAPTPSDAAKARAAIAKATP